MLENPGRSVTLDTLRSGKPVFCYKANFTCPRVVEIVGSCGYDCIWLCMEHTANDYGVLERQIYAARATGMDTLVRIPRGSYSDMIKPLELNASGVMVPHVMSADDARQIVRTLRFHPQGLRPIDGGNADGMYCMYPFNDYLKWANENRFIFLQIEDKEAMEHLDEICAVPGFDAVFFGPGDFSQSIGDPGNMNNPELLRAVELVAKTAVKHGKIAGIPGAPTTWRARYEMGYRFFSMGADVIAIQNNCKELLAQTKFATI